MKNFNNLHEVQKVSKSKAIKILENLIQETEDQVALKELLKVYTYFTDLGATTKPGDVHALLQRFTGTRDNMGVYQYYVEDDLCFATDTYRMISVENPGIKEGKYLKGHAQDNTYRGPDFRGILKSIDKGMKIENFNIKDYVSSQDAEIKSLYRLDLPTENDKRTQVNLKYLQDFCSCCQDITFYIPARNNSVVYFTGTFNGLVVEYILMPLASRD